MQRLSGCNTLRRGALRFGRRQFEHALIQIRRNLVDINRHRQVEPSK